MQKVWQVAEDQPVQTGEEFAEFHPVVRRMLARRGLRTPEEMRAFLNPNWDTDIHDPFLFKQMQAAVDRIFSAMENGEHVVIHGDYDADGVTGSVVLAETIKMLVKLIRPQTSDQIQNAPVEGIDPEKTVQGLEAAGPEKEKFYNVLNQERDGFDLDVYIPHREKEGYGLNTASVATIADRGANLLITVDCGIANVVEIAAARALGLDAIVVDHHQFGEILPDAILVHPKLPGEDYPFKDLAAVGVAWKLACALSAHGTRRGFSVPAGWDKWLLDLVSIATVTDIVPLRGENRVLEKYGLKVLNFKRRPGLRALIDNAGWRKGETDAETVAFVIGPRINAAGRMEHAYLAVDLLMETDPAVAVIKASALESVNKNRQKATESMMNEAKTMVGGLDGHSLIFAWSDTWSPSLVGLAAGRYADMYGKPAVFVGKFEGVWIGSGRSIPNYDITAAVRESGDGLLTRHGGHAQACGFSLDADDKVEKFAQTLREHANKSLAENELRPRLKLEAELGLRDLDQSLLRTLEMFEPFGDCNPKPIFLSRNLTVVETALVGAGQNHLKCVLKSQDGAAQKFMGFYRVDLADIMSPGSKVDVAYEVSGSEWNGRREVQCKIVDARPAQTEMAET